MMKEICWNITALCNQSCKYCHRFLNIKNLSYEENLKILDNLIDSGVDHITWTGGEALVLDYLDDLLKISSDKGIKNKLITNGRLLTRDRLDKIYKYLDNITLSIDSIDNGINETLGRGKYHFKEIQNILEYITEKNYDIKVSINTVICKYNLHDVVSLSNFLNNYNIWSWRIFKFMPLRETALNNQKMFEITLDEYNSVIKEIVENTNIKKVDTRLQDDMEQKYILILADGSIIITENGTDNKVGHALIDSFKKYL